MLGINDVGNNWKFVVANFIITLVAFIIYSLIQTVPQNRLPTEVEVFWAFVVALGEAFTIYGINKTMKKEEL
jgi:hypothetical protein